MDVSDRDALLREYVPIARRAVPDFDMKGAEVALEGSDHGFSSWIITGLTSEQHLFDKYLLYVEDADDLRITVLRWPDDGGSCQVQTITVDYTERG